MTGRKLRARAGTSGAPRTRCQYCDGYFTAEHLNVDHIVPKAMGGRSSRVNLAACCKACNNKKADTDPRVFWRSLYPDWGAAVPAWLEAAVTLAGLPPLAEEPVGEAAASAPAADVLEGP